MAKVAPLDADQKAYLEAAGRLPVPFPGGTRDPRQMSSNWEASTLPSKEILKSITNRTIPGPNGDIPIRIYIPDSKDESLPVLVYFHGGCWIMGNLETHDPVLRRLANVAKCAIVSVDYRLAPEHKFPMGLEDCYAAAAWAASNAASEFGGDGARLALGGDSCGGNLAAAVALLAKERGGPALALQLLLYPMTDHYASGNNSLRAYGSGYVFDYWLDELCWDIYGCCDAPHGTKEAPNYHAAVLRAPDLSGLPPAHVVLAECDVVRDEGEQYAKRLAEAGVSVTVREYTGSVHGHMSSAVQAEIMGLAIPKGIEAIAEAATALQQAFAKVKEA